MFLLSVSRKVFLATVFSATAASAEFVSVEGSYLFPKTMSEAACYQKALMQAKQNAVRQVVGERLSNELLEVCNETEERTSCSLFQQTLNWFDNGYLASLKHDRSLDTVRKQDGFNECVVNITAEVRKFNSEHDPEFALLAEIEGPRRKRDGDVISISGQSSQQAYLSLLGWYPEFDGDNFYKIVPNDFDEPSVIKGKFAFPSSQAQRQYQVLVEWAQAYRDLETSEASEVLLVLATKKDFPLLDKEKSEDFYRRLDALGRENWKIAKLTYFVMRND